MRVVGLNRAVPSRRWAGLLAVAAVLSVAVVAAAEPARAVTRSSPSPTAGSVAAAALPPCSPYLVIGVRGSGESYSGFFGMGNYAVSPYAREASEVLPSTTTRYYSLEYPAADVIVGPELWYASVNAGVSKLKDVVRDRTANCPGIRIGLMGYSQGAFVINSALQGMDAATRNHIRAVLLIADPLSTGRAASYGVWTTIDGRDAPRNGHGLLGNLKLPSDMWGRTRELCIVGDIVCDYNLPSTPLFQQLVAAIGFSLHFGYAGCCQTLSFPIALGEEFAYRLMDPWSPGGPPPPTPPAPPNPPPAGPQPVTSVYGLPDGTVLNTTDTGRTYKMVGGAPVWLSSCANNLCPSPRPTTQAVINAGPPVPADGATASDEGGNVFKFVGGAPIHLSSCSVGCGSPVPITAWSFVNLDHMRPVPADGATARDEGGNVFKFVGGAPIHLSSCSVGCGNPVPVNGWSVAHLDHMSAVPADGATARDEGGNVFKFVGGAPIHLSNCSVGCGNPVAINGWSVANLEHMRPYPVDGSTARDESGNIFKFAGGAPIRLASCAVGCGNPVQINGSSVATLEHMRPHPVDRATVVDENGAVFVFAGGSPLWLSTCNPGCGTPVRINRWSIDNREHMRPVPANGTRVVAVDPFNNTQYAFTDGIADIAGPCPATPGCDTAIPVNQVSVEDLTDPVANHGPAYGQLSRYYNPVSRDHMTTTGVVPPGFRHEWVLGQTLVAPEPGTRALYGCTINGELFTSVRSDCEGHPKVSDLGFVYDSPREGTQALHRCVAGTEHFDSISTTCEGAANAIREFTLGYVVAYAGLVRYRSSAPVDHASLAVTGRLPTGYRPERTIGMVPLVQLSGTVPLWRCRIGTDEFTSTQANCEGQQVIGRQGYIWTAKPADLPTVPLHRCIVTGTGQHFDSTSAGCEGQTVDGGAPPRGWILARAVLSRSIRGGDHAGGTGALPSGYRMEFMLGTVATALEPGTRLLYECANGWDHFPAFDAGCEGKQLVGPLGYIWTSPPSGRQSRPLYRCLVDESGDHFISTDPACEGRRPEYTAPLGYVLNTH